MTEDAVPSDVEADDGSGATPLETGDEADVTDETQLERTIGLGGALSIGVGTMIGAGIFVFPGLAAEQAGPAAAMSFVIGGVVALLVALPASELATAMPRSGGGYYFVSRSMGSLAGAVVGIGLYLGLVFATAFYLVGLGHYFDALLAESGAGLPFSPVAPLAVVFAAVLTAVSVTGTENTAKLQNLVVGVLVVILTGFLTYGAADVLGVFGSESTPEEFAPFGYPPVLTTAALVFTSYLGFAQVATVAGDVKRPSRNLPLGMVGSVVIVTAFYVVTMFVATGSFGGGRLGEFGETAMIEVARNLLGLPGALAILFAGLLATFSSANASILASSRAVYAVSRDAIVPERASRVNLRYGTPHVALGMVGGPVLVLAATGQVALLAEVASFLHLVMYGLICFAVVVIRRDPPDWYDPEFETPFSPVLPAVGGLASFALIAFMQLESQMVGLLVMAAAAVWYLYYARDVNLKGVL